MLDKVSLSIRNLSDDSYNRLRIRAAANGRSMEAEARALIERAANEPLQERPLWSSMSAQDRAAYVEGLRQHRLAHSGGRVLPDSTPGIRRDRESR
ncbi:MAG: FitA-like ribbon-helix-helix domain-containing protein [Panacagrimonas sp.]